jgi:hypothetical protein
LKPQNLNPSFVVKQGTEISLSGAALVELMTAVLEKGRSFRFLAKGFSMTPFIRNGDVVTISPFLGRRANMGEVVAFIHPHNQGLAVHRIIGRRKSHYLIQGDNVPEADGVVPERQLLGYVDRVERRGRTVNLGLGPERRVIALLNKKGWMFQLRFVLGRLLRPLRDRLHSRSDGAVSDEEK